MDDRVQGHRLMLVDDRVQGHRLMLEDDEGNFIYLNLELTSEELDLFRALIDNRSNGRTHYASSFETGQPDV